MGGRVGGGQGGCERRIEVFGKIQKENRGGGVRRGKFTNKRNSGGGGGSVAEVGSGGGSGWWGDQGGCERNVGGRG